jgi:hypothetical protein
MHDLRGANTKKVVEGIRRGTAGGAWTAGAALHNLATMLAQERFAIPAKTGLLMLGQAALFSC